MQHKLIKPFVLMFLLVFIRTLAFADDIPSRPNPPRLVNDFAAIFTQSQADQLEYKLRYFNDTTSNQIVVVTVKSLNGLEPYEFATELGQKWGVGQKKFDNGIVVLIKPKYGNSRGQAFIAPGYGLTGVIPDATAYRIVQDEMIPEFKKGDYYAGVNKAVDVLIKLASGEISAKGYNKMHPKNNPLFVLVPFIAIFLIFLLIRVSNRSNYTMANGGGSGFWTALWLGSMLGNSNRSGNHWNNFTNGGSGFGGGGFGGGFGGFGGGSFGGGGAGGSW
ncbi:MAG: TPM domain-containing protein [Bacteroidales bacterium]|nr:TPM domain-containing protein [Bacteroidales bacterium]